MMKKPTYFVIVLALISATPFFAQNSNIFLDRDYWKTNPSISEIDKKIVQGNDIAELNAYAFDAVCYALIEKADNKTVKYLLTKKGNDVNKRTHDGRTYIFWAAYKSNLDIMQHLVTNGAKTDIKDSYGDTVVTFAAGAGQINTALYDFLIKNGAKLSEQKNRVGANALHLLAPYFTVISEMDYFIENGIALTSSDTKGNGVFNYAAKGGNISFLKALIKKELPYKKVNKNGGNAMLFASQGKRGFQNTLETYKFLDGIGVESNVTGNQSRNPLHYIASKSEDLEIFKFFINKVVDINQQDDSGDSPFMNAANSNTFNVVKYLSTYVKDINTKNENGRSALALAINNNHAEVAEFLLEKGADINVVDNYGNTLAFYLMNTFRSNNLEAFNKKLELLKKNGLNLSLAQGNGNTLYHNAIEKNNLALLKRIETFGIDLNTKNKEGMTPLHLAAMKAQDETILEYLISRGADKIVKTDFEESVYDLALENELLQKHNIDISFLK
jgi:ankyrin repeat protein